MLLVAHHDYLVNCQGHSRRGRWRWEGRRTIVVVYDFSLLALREVEEADDKSFVPAVYTTSTLSKQPSKLPPKEPSKLG
jgi:hypothetical protein